MMIKLTNVKYFFIFQNREYIQKFLNYQRQRLLFWFLDYLKTIISFKRLNYLHNSVIITVDANHLFFILSFIKKHTNIQCNTLSTISGIDFLHKKIRYTVVYEMVSTVFNQRLRIKALVNNIFLNDSIKMLYSAADWCECEVWDMFGIFFKNNTNLKRILTDYGFEGHPLKKDFPLSGYVELRFDESLKRMVCEPLEYNQEFRNFDFTTGWSTN